MERWRNTLESEIYQEYLISVAENVCYRMGDFKQQQESGILGIRAILIMLY